MRNKLTALPAHAFDGLTALQFLWLNDNELTGLPAGVFGGLTALEELWLSENDLSTLPADIFKPLTALTELRLYLNPGYKFGPEADAGTDRTVDEGERVTLSGSEDGDPWGRTLTYAWMQTDSSGHTVTLTGGDTLAPTFVAPDVTADTVLRFRLTVTADTSVSPPGDPRDSDEDEVEITVRPTVDLIASTGIELTSDPGADNTYAISDTVTATVTFSAAVDITGTPQLELDFDGTPKPANCTAATNTTSIGCYYTVAENDSAPNGIAIAANKLTLNGGTITATGSTTINADLDHGAVA